MGWSRIITEREKERTIFRFLRLFVRPRRPPPNTNPPSRSHKFLLPFLRAYRNAPSTVFFRPSVRPSPSGGIFTPSSSLRSDIRSDSIHSPFSLLRKSADPMERRVVRRERGTTHLVMRWGSLIGQCEFFKMGKVPRFSSVHG